MRPLGLRRVHLELATVAPLPASLPAHRGASVDPGAAFRARPTYTNLGQWRRDFLVVEDPNDAEEPEWVWDFVRAVEAARAKIDSSSVSGLTSNKVFSVLRPYLLPLGYLIEEDSSKRKVIRQLVLFGEQGREAETPDAYGRDLRR